MIKYARIVLSNIVGDPILGGIDNQDNYDSLMQQIQSVVDADSADQ